MGGSMTEFLVLVLLTGMTVLGTEGSSPSVSSDQAPIVTFNKDVLPILQNNCQTCHRPGGIGPMSFLTYESTRPWAKAIKSAVLSRQMPPWFADPHYGEFRNAPKLNEADIRTLAAWADNGAREGNAADKPADRDWADGWRIQPDVVVSMAQPYHVSAKGAGEIREFFVPSPFKEDTWVKSIEIRPGDPSVVHHVIVQVPEQPFTMKKGACLDCVQGVVAQNAFFIAEGRRVDDLPQGGGGGGYNGPLAKLKERQTGLGAFTTMEAVYAPGAPPLDFRFTGSAKLIPGGKPIRIEVHYTPNGKDTMDRTRVGFTLAKAPADRRFVIMAPEHLVDSRKPIPAGATDYETRGELTFNKSVELVWFMPHMHLRGKDMTFRLVYPNGREETVLSTKFNFHWQLGYEVEEPIKVPAGTKMIVTAHHDNSANNRLNPEPDKDVAWGEMTGQEMMLPWFGVVVEGNAQPDAIAMYRPGDFDGSSIPTNVIRQKPVVKLTVPFDPNARMPAVVQPAVIRDAENLKLKIDK
jgi:hypothetical protein